MYLRRVKWNASILLFLLCIGYGALNIYNGRFEMRDLQVYYDAAGMLLQGDSPYGQAFGLSSGFYKYSALAALVFTPFHLIGWFATRVVYFILLSWAIAYFIPEMTWRVGWRFHSFASRKWAIVMLLVALSLMGHLSRELLLGNVNWFLMMLVIAAFRLMRKQSFLAGVLFALALAFKPHFAVMIPWLALRREWRVLATSLLGFGVFLLLPSIFLGWEAMSALNQEWLQAIVAHNDKLSASPNTIFGGFSNLTKLQGSWIMLSAITGTALVIFIWMLRNFRAERQHPQREVDHRFLEFMTLIALVPNLVHTDTEHFMWTFPLIAVLAWSTLNLVAKQWVKYTLIAQLWLLALIPYSFNTPDVWGKEWAVFFDLSGILGLANLVIILLAHYAAKLPTLKVES